MTTLTTTGGRGLGGFRTFDPRNLDYLIDDVVHVSGATQRAAVMAARAGGALLEREGAAGGTPVGKYHHAEAWWGDQGDTPMCTAYALLHAMADGPVTHRQAPLANPAELYAAIQQQDRQAGRYFSEGATSLAMAMEAKARGWIGEFRWGYTLAPVVAALVEVGPVLIGIDWPDGMDSPDPKHSVIRWRGRNRGGHEIEVNGIDLDDGMVRVKQSWGRTWSRHRGHAYLPMEDLERALANGGEALLFRELPSAEVTRG